VLSKPNEGEVIPESTFSYLRTRNRLRAFDLVQAEFDRAGITQAALAVRMDKDPAQLNRLLGAPGNWTFDTFSDLLFAIAGGVPAYSVDFPLDKPIRNWTQPDWIWDGAFLEGDWHPAPSDNFHIDLHLIMPSEWRPPLYGSLSSDEPYELEQPKIDVRKLSAT